MVDSATHGKAVELLCQGYKPKAIATLLGLSKRQIYEMLASETETYLPAETPNVVWRSARATAVQLLTSIGLQQKTVAKLFNYHPAQVVRLKRSKPGGSPVIKIEVLSTVTTATREQIKPGTYTLHAAGKPDVVCLATLPEGSIYFVDTIALCHKVKVISLTGVN